MRDSGIDEVLVYCVNDAAVMEAWAKDQKVAGTNITVRGIPPQPDHVGDPTPRALTATAHVPVCVCVHAFGRSSFSPTRRAR